MRDQHSICSCGEVHVMLMGNPMVSTKCFCDDCQAAADFFAQEPYGQHMLEDDHGTSFDLYRNDRYEVIQGADKLKPVKVKGRSITNRNVATCCNSVLFASFDRGPHWVSVYRKHIDNELLPFTYYIQTKFSPHPVSTPLGVKSAKTYPPTMMAKLMSERLKMMIGF